MIYIRNISVVAKETAKKSVFESKLSKKEIAKRSSYKGHTVDALALRAEEGRGKLRKATTSCKQALTRRSPNGKTRME